MSERPEDVLTDAIEHYDHGLFTRQEALAALQQLTEEAARLRPIHDFCVANTCTVLSPPSTNEERCGAISLDGVTCQLVEGHQGVHKNDARRWRNAAHPATNGEREEGS